MAEDTTAPWRTAISDAREDEILYLKITDEERLRQLRAFSNAHLEATDEGGESA